MKKIDNEICDFDFIELLKEVKSLYNIQRILMHLWDKSDKNFSVQDELSSFKKRMSQDALEKLNKLLSDDMMNIIDTRKEVIYDSQTIASILFKNILNQIAIRQKLSDKDIESLANSFCIDWAKLKLYEPEHIDLNKYLEGNNK